MKLLLSVDLEDFRYLRLAQLGLPPKNDNAAVLRGIETFLNVLEKSASGEKSKVTFFTTGQIARDFPELVRELSAAGHEIACHGYEHENLARMNGTNFAPALDSALEYLKQASGQDVFGFRAPSFSADIRSTELHQLLVARKFLYDSSVLLEHNRTGEDRVISIEKRGKSLIEFPLLVRRFRMFPPMRIIGGTYFRILPTRFVKDMLKFAESWNYIPTLYLHASDFLPSYAAVHVSEAWKAGRKSILRWYPKHLESTWGGASASSKLELILKDCELLGTYLGRANHKLKETLH